jgi:hypothetical protein
VITAIVPRKFDINHAVIYVLKAFRSQIATPILFYNRSLRERANQKTKCLAAGYDEDTSINTVVVVNFASW